MKETYSFMPSDSSDNEFINFDQDEADQFFYVDEQNRTDQNSSENVSNGSTNLNASSISSSFSFNISDIDQFALEDEADQLFYEDEQNKTDQNSSENVSNGSTNSNASSTLPSFSFNISDIDQSELDRAILILNPNQNGSQIGNPNVNQQSLFEMESRSSAKVQSTKYKTVRQNNQRQKAPRRKPQRSSKGIEFEKEYNKVVGAGPKGAYKTLINKYHKILIEESISNAKKKEQIIPKSSREATRVKWFYFEEHAKNDKDKLIIQTLQKCISNHKIKYDEDAKKEKEKNDRRRKPDGDY